MWTRIIVSYIIDESDTTDTDYYLLDSNIDKKHIYKCRDFTINEPDYSERNSVHSH